MTNTKKSSSAIPSVGPAILKGGSVADLEKVLMEEIDLYEKYLGFLQSDSEFMTKLKIDELENNNKSKTTLLLKIQAVDQARQTLVKNIAQSKGIKEEKIKIQDLCGALTPTESARLLKLRDRLSALVDQLKKIQGQTTQLAHTSLAWINSSMATLQRMLTPTGTYNPQGRVDKPGLFSGRVVEKQV